MAQEHSILVARRDRTELISPRALRPSKVEPHTAARPGRRNWPLLSRTEIRGVAELSRPPSASIEADKAKLRSDRSVMAQMDALKRDPAWRLEKLGQQTRDVTWRSFDAAMELLREGLQRGLTAALLGGRRIQETIGKAMTEAWNASRSMSRPGRDTFAPEIRIGKPSTLARNAELRAKAHPEGHVVARLQMGTQVFVLENYAAPDGFVLVQTADGEIGFLAR
jgi:hypothetical protein